MGPAGSLGRARSQGMVAAVLWRRPEGRLHVPRGKLPVVGRTLGLDRPGRGLALAWRLEEGFDALDLRLGVEQYHGRGDLTGAGAEWRGLPLSGPVRTRLSLARLDAVLVDGALLGWSSPWSARAEYGLTVAWSAWDLDPGPGGQPGGQWPGRPGGQDWSLVPWVGTGFRVAPWPRIPVLPGLDVSGRAGILRSSALLGGLVDWAGGWELGLSWRGFQAPGTNSGWECRASWGREGLLVDGGDQPGRYLREGLRVDVGWSF